MDQLSYWLCSSTVEWEPIDDEYKALLAEYKAENITAEGEEPQVKCRQALPYIKTYDPANDYRIGSMVGFVIAGKLAMWNRRYDKAIEFYKYIEDVYGCLDIATGEYLPLTALMDYPMSDVMFRNRYTAESIFEIPGYAKEYGMRVTSNLAAHCMPRRKSTASEGDAAEEEDGESFEDELVDHSKKDDVYAGIRIPELGGDARTSAPYRPTKYFYGTLLKYTDIADKRCSVFDTTKYKQFEDGGIYPIEGSAGCLAWCYSGWLPEENINEAPRRMHFLSGTSSSNKPARPYLGDKFWCPGMIYTQDSNNLKVFRFAHVLLDLAEANMWIENWKDAIGYLNASCNRAGRTHYADGDVNTQETFMQALMDESARELFGEYTRRHNLIRWGAWRDQIIKYSDNSLLKTNVTARPYLEYYPIPEEQVILSNRMLDNNKYEGLE